MKNRLLFLNKIFLLLLIPLIARGEILRDPTLPPNLPASAAQSSSSFLLTAIFTYPNDRFAIINNNISRVGNHLDNFTITNITPDTVELSGSEGRFEQLKIAPTVKSELLK